MAPVFKLDLHVYIEEQVANSFYKTLIVQLCK